MKIYLRKDAANKNPHMVARFRRRSREAKRARRNFPLRDPFDKLPRGARKFSSTSLFRSVVLMSSSDPAKAAHDRRQRKLLILLALGFVTFGAAASALFYVLQPETLRIAVGPAGSDDHQVVQAMAVAFEEESRTVRLTPITTSGAAESRFAGGR